MKLFSIFPAVIAAALAGLVSVPAMAQAPEWVMQPDDSALTFTAWQSRSPIEGRFEEFEATIHFDPDDLKAGRVEVTIVMNSATTDDDSRDETLKSQSLFNVESYPSGSFIAQGFEKGEGENAYLAPGELTLRGVTNPVTLPFTLVIEGEGSGARAHAEGSITIKRLDYGVGQGDWADTSTVADKVDIGLDIRAVRR